MATKVKLLADNIVGANQLADNVGFTGSEGVTLPSGTTAERPSSPATGVFRFNTTTDVMEYYDGALWQTLGNAPGVTSISPTTETDANADITITGTNFKTGATVQFIGDDGTVYNSPSVTVNSTTTITATTPSSALTVANEPYDVKVNNPGNFSGTLVNALDAGSTPAFGVASGSLGTVIEGTAASAFTQITATDGDGQSVSITLKSGSSLPSGVSMSTSGVFSGTTPTTGSSVTTTFTVEATDGVNTAERDYTITVRPYLYAQLSGSGTWSVPSGTDSAEILIVGGGASGTRVPNIGAGGGGAGGIVHTSSYTFTSTDKSSGIAYSVGDGGDGLGISPYAFDGGFNNGEDSTFALSGGTITAKGGGGGGGYGGNSPHYGGNSVTPAFSQSYFSAHTGGSGGGGAWNNLNGAASNQGTFSGWTSYGNSGGTFNTSGSGNYNGSGGGGAGAAGTGATVTVGGAGGAGQLFSSFTSYGESGYFGGGGGGGQTGGTRPAGGIGGGGQGGNGVSGTQNYDGEDATDGTGGGGGGTSVIGYANYTLKSGDGGNGTILIRY